MDTKLIDIFIKNKKQIRDEWVELVRSIPNTNYLERPLSELYASAEEGLNSFIEIFRNSSYKRLDAYIHKVSMTRIKMGFDISEVTQALLLMKEAVSAHIIQELIDTPEELKSAFTMLDQAMRWNISRFNELYSRAINKQLQQNFEELKKHDAQLAKKKEELEQKVHQISSLVKSARVVNSTLDLDKVLTYIIEQACDLIRTKRCIIYELDEKARELRIRVTRADIPDAEKYQNMPLLVDEEFIQFVTQHEQILKIDDIKLEPRDELKSLIPILKQANIQAMLAVPLIRQRNILGGIAVFFNEPHKFSTEEISLLSTFSVHAALAMENARLYERSHQAAILRERNRLAREIHDTLAQGLTGIVLQLEVIDRLIHKDLDKTRSKIKKVKELARNNLKEVRRSVWGLRSGDKIQPSLVDSIKAEIKKMQLETNLESFFNIKGDFYSLSPEAENHIFRIFQESINNVIQHARAKHVWIELIYKVEIFTMHIKDDGIGLKSIEGKKSGVDKGFGLMGIQERARFLQGQLKIDSSEGKGTTITIHIPAKTWYHHEAQSKNIELT